MNPVSILLPDQFHRRYFSPKKRSEHQHYDINSFCLHKIERSCHSLKLPSLPYRNTAHECILVTRGELIRSSGAEMHSIKANNVYFVPAGQITSIQSVSDDARGFYCHFDTAMLVSKFAGLQVMEEFGFLRAMSNPIMNLSVEGVSRLEYLFERIVDEGASDFGGGLIQSYLLAILFELKQYHESIHTAAVNASQNLTENFKQLVLNNVKSSKKVAEYAQLLNVTPNHLNKAVKYVSGKSPSAWIDELIILEAKVLLCQSRLTISEISYELGLDDPSYFGRLFKKYSGLTPTQFRKRNLKSIAA